jgi:hypothetical protein
MHKFLAALLFTSGLGALAAEPIAMVPRSDPAVVEMERVYRGYLKAGKSADKPAFLAAMSARARGALEKVRPELLVSMSQDDLDPSDAAFVRADRRQSAARLVYSKDFSDSVRWQGLIFVKEKDGWRIDRVVAAVDPKTLSAETRLKVGPLGLENLLAHPNMQLPAP